MAEYKPYEIKFDFTDIEGLQNRFEELMRTIEETRDKISSLKKENKDCSSEVSNLNKSESELLSVMSMLGSKIDLHNQKYKNISKTMGDLIKKSKDLTLTERDAFFTGPINTFNNALKQADASIGNFSRSVGNYKNEMQKAMNSVSVQATMVLRELPSLANSPQQFMMAISNNLPYLIDSIGEYAKAAKRAASSQHLLNVATGEGVVLGAENASVNKSNTNALSLSAKDMEYATTTITFYNAALDANKKKIAELEGWIYKIHTTRRRGDVSILEESQILELQSKGILFNTEEWIKNGNAIKDDTGALLLNEQAQRELERSISKSREELRSQQKKMRESFDDFAASGYKSKLTLKDYTRGLFAAIKSLFSFNSLLVIGGTLLLVYWKDIMKWLDGFGEIESSFVRGSNSLKEWNEALKGANEGAAKSATELLVYSKYITLYNNKIEEYKKHNKDVANVEKEKAFAVKKVVDILKEQGEAIDENAIAEGNFGDVIDETTAKLIKQAQAQAMMNKITEKYQDVLDKQSEAANVEANGVKVYDKYVANLNNQQSYYGQTSLSAEDILKSRIDNAKKEAEDAKVAFDEWLKKFLGTFNASDLDSGTNKDSSYGASDRWKSIWEQKIKEREEALKMSVIKMEGFETDFLQYSDKEWWKYTEQGNMYFNNMIEEYRAHYKKMMDEGKITADTYEANIIELEAKENKYRKDAALYFDKLAKQYIHPNYEKETLALEEWYLLEIERYKSLNLLSEHQADIDKEFYYRKYELAKKFRDEFETSAYYTQSGMSSAEMNMRTELDKLDLWFNDELIAYEKEGKDINNLELEYLHRSAVIRDSWRKEELEKQKNYITQEYSLKSSEISAAYTNYANSNVLGGRTGYDIYKSGETEKSAGNGGYQLGKNQGYEERMYAMDEMVLQWQLKQEEINAQIDAINSKEWETIEEQEAAALETANLRNELALGSAEFQMNMDKAVADNAKQLWDERTNAASNSFKVMGDLMSNISSLCEEGTEEYKGFAAAGAAMSSIASAVDAYKSVVGIPYVGMILAPIAAASALAAGAAQIKQILATKADGSNATSVLSNAYVGAMPSEITGAVRAQAVTTGNNETVNVNTGNQRVYIVDKDIDDGLNGYRAKVSNTSF